MTPDRPARARPPTSAASHPVAPRASPASPDRTPAKDWYRTRSIGDGITFIDEPVIQEFYRCNIWRARGRDRDMLVDSGMGVVSLSE